MLISLIRTVFVLGLSLQYLIASLDEYAIQSILPVSSSPEKKIVGVFGANSLTCFRAPSIAYSENVAEYEINSMIIE